MHFIRPTIFFAVALFIRTASGCCACGPPWGIQCRQEGESCGWGGDCCGGICAFGVSFTTHGLEVYPRLFIELRIQSCVNSGPCCGCAYGDGGPCKPTVQSCTMNSECCGDLCVLGVSIFSSSERSFSLPLTLHNFSCVLDSELKPTSHYS